MSEEPLIDRRDGAPTCEPEAQSRSTGRQGTEPLSQCDMCDEAAMVRVSGAGFGPMTVCANHADNAFAVARSAIDSLLAYWRGETTTDA